MTTPPNVAPCSWPLDTSCCPEWDTYTPDQQTAATAWATEILWALSGRQFGSCPVTVRPCGTGCSTSIGYTAFPVQSDSRSSTWMFPYQDRSGAWRNCACSGGCSCSATCEVYLPGPVGAVTEVSVDGVVLDPSAYRVDNGDTLVRTDGGCFPDCQNMDLALTEENTFSVTYQRGAAVPAAGQLAAGILACSYAKSCATGCTLPGNLASLDRQGTSITLIDPTETLNAGLTGIHQVDLWLRSVNPSQLRRRLRVYSPDVTVPRRVS